VAAQEIIDAADRLRNFPMVVLVVVRVGGVGADVVPRLHAPLHNLVVYPLLPQRINHRRDALLRREPVLLAELAKILRAPNKTGERHGRLGG
jgi:hypothetical protein